VFKCLTALLALVVLVAAACGGDDDDAMPSGVTTAVPTPTAEATSTPVRTPTAEATSTPVPAPRSSTAQPTPLSNQLAALGGEDSAVIAELLGELTPRCQQSPEEVAELLERVWRALRESYDIALPVTSIIARILFELPAGASGENCETLITAVVTDIVGGR
jgi:hypothetical protein